MTIATDPLGEHLITKRPHALVRDEGPYSARNSSKGALLEEAARLFGALHSGLTIDELREQTMRGTLLSQRSSLNRKRIWWSINQRYLVSDVPWLLTLLAEKSMLGPLDPEFSTLLYLLYALKDRLTYEFVTTILWLKGCHHRPVITRNDVLDFLKTAATKQSQIDRWSESTRKKLAGGVLTALRDFGLLEGKQKKHLVRPKLPISTATAVLRILVSEGARGRSVLEDPTWRLFLIDEREVAQCLVRVAQEGVIQFEKAGSTVVLETPASWETPAHE